MKYHDIYSPDLTLSYNTMGLFVDAMVRLLDITDTEIFDIEYQRWRAWHTHHTIAPAPTEGTMTLDTKYRVHFVNTMVTLLGIPWTLDAVEIDGSHFGANGVVMLHFKRPL